MTNTAKELNKFRETIDRIDTQVIEMLNERARNAVEIGKLKNNKGMPFYAPEREKKIYDNIRERNKGPLPDKVFFAIYRELMSGCLSLEKPLRIAFLGPEGSFSHLAATRKFGASVDYIPTEDIREVFVEVAQGHCDLGLTPVENSAGGVIIDTLDAFQELDVKICAELLLPIHHNLLANCPKNEIKQIYSKPEIFSQCKNWISEHFMGIETIPEPSSSKAAELASKKKGAAAIGSKLAATLYKLNIVCKNIEDNPNNTTRFFVISKQSAKQTENDKTSIMLVTAHKAGALADVLDVFRQYKVNLTSIDSRPSRQQSWEYYFFVEIEGHAEDQKVHNAIEEVKKHCLKLTVLGSFAKAEETIE